MNVLHRLFRRTPDTGLSSILLAEVLTSHRRKQLVRFLGEHGDGTTISEAAEHVAAREHDFDDVDELTSQQRKRVYISLYQTHLGVLDDLDVIEWDERSGVILPGPELDAVIYASNDLSRLAGEQ